MQENKSLKSSFSRSSAHVFLGKLVRYSLQYATQIVLINLLLPSDFGIMRYVTLLVGIAGLINEMGLTTAIVQKQKISSDEISGSFMMSVIWGMVLYFFIFFSAPQAASFFNNHQLVSFLRIGSLLIPVASVCAVPRALLQKQMRFGTLALIEAAAAVVSSCIMIIMAFRGFGTWSLIAGSLIQEVLSLTGFAILVKIPGFHIRSILLSRNILGMGAGLVFLRILDYVRFSLPFFVIGKLFDEKSLGLFSISYDISLLPQVIINSVLGNVMISAFSKLQNDKNRTENGFSQLTFFASAAVIPVLLTMSILSTEILNTICFLKNNDSWLEASGAMRWLSLMGLIYTVSLFPGTIWLSNKKIVPAIFWSSIMFITTLVALFVSAGWGIEGIAAALFIRAAVTFPVLMYVNYKVTGIKMEVYLKSIYPPLVCGVIMILPMILIQYVFNGISLSRNITVLIVSCAAGAALYLFLLNRLFRPLLTPLFDLLRKPRELIV